MSLLVLLIVLIVLFGGGGLSYGRWRGTGPAWGGNVLFLLALVLLVFLVLRMVGTHPF